MDSLNRVHLSGLRAAEATARLGSLSRAAGELQVSVGAVSQRITRLEEALGCRLFDRVARGMVPTDTGREVMALLSSGFGQLGAAVDLATRDRSHTLTVSVAPIFAARWLVWRLPRFSERHPDIRVRVDSDTRLLDPNTSDADLCIRIGRGGWSDVRAERLFDQRVMPVCAPALAERLQKPEDLAHVPIIRDLNAAFSWNDWLTPIGLDPAMLGPGPEFSDGAVAFDAAMSGAGVFLAWETLDLNALDRGLVVAPFDRREPTGHSYWLISAGDRAVSPATRYFIRWMKEELAADGIPLCD